MSKIVIVCINTDDIEKNHSLYGKLIVGEKYKLRKIESLLGNMIMGIRENGDEDRFIGFIVEDKFKKTFRIFSEWREEQINEILNG